MTADWSRKFDEPIPLAKGRQLVTLKDAGTYITKPPKTEHMTAEWQAAMEALIIRTTAKRYTLLHHDKETHFANLEGSVCVYRKGQTGVLMHRPPLTATMEGIDHGNPR
jgi:hypothetical protein